MSEQEREIKKQTDRQRQIEGTGQRHAMLEPGQKPLIKRKLLHPDKNG